MCFWLTALRVSKGSKHFASVLIVLSLRFTCDCLCFVCLDYLVTHCFFVFCGYFSLHSSIRERLTFFGSSLLKFVLRQIDNCVLFHCSITVQDYLASVEYAKHIRICYDLDYYQTNYLVQWQRSLVSLQNNGIFLFPSKLHFPSKCIFPCCSRV